MGTGNLLNQADGEIADAADVQQVLDALKQNFVPRNSSGVPTDQAGDLGTSVLRWGQTYVSRLILGAIANGLSIEELTAEIVLKVGSSVVATIGADGIERESMKLFTPISSANFSLTTTSTTYLDSATSAIDITTTGGPVWVGLISSNSGLFSRLKSSSSTTQGSTSYFRITRAGSAIAEYQLGQGSSTASVYNQVSVPASCLFTIETPAAGTHTYKVGARSLVTSATSAIDASKLVAYEIR